MWPNVTQSEQSKKPWQLIFFTLKSQKDCFPTMVSKQHILAQVLFDFFYHICSVESFNHSLYFLNVSLLGILWKKGKIRGLFLLLLIGKHIF